MNKTKILVVKGISIATSKVGDEVYISLTDIARNKNASEPKDVVKNWLRSKTTIEFLGIWEQLYNPDFKGVEFDSFLYEAGSNSFKLAPSKVNMPAIAFSAGFSQQKFEYIPWELEFSN